MLWMHVNAVIKNILTDHLRMRAERSPDVMLVWFLADGIKHFATVNKLLLMAVLVNGFWFLAQTKTFGFNLPYHAVFRWRGR